MRPVQVRSLVEAGVMSAVAIIFALISVYVPLLGSLVNLIWPVPIILLGVRHGYKWSIMATAVSGMMIAILIEPVLAVKTVVGFSLIGIVLGHAIREKYSPVKTLLCGSVAALISNLAVLGLVMLILGINPLNMDFQMMEKTMEEVMNIYRSQGISEEDIARAGELMRNVFVLMQVLIPAMFALGAVMTTYINFACARLVLRRLGQPTPGFPPFKHWKMPESVLWAFIAGTAMTYLGSTQQMDLVYRIGENVRWFGLIFTLVQGLAVFYFLADKYNLSRMVRGIILLLTFTVPILAYVAIYAGAFDIALDYRKLRKPRES
ncbi:MAG: YybS family protein [Negativicutes bacterium]|nr:YybS family protein [Negativicutes bacterium]